MKPRARHLVACLAVFAAVAALPAAPATASKASIKAALTSYSAQLTALEPKIASAIEQYASTKNATAVESTISEELTVLRELRATVKAQRAGSPRVRFAKTEVVDGLSAVTAGYEHLAKTYADAAVAPHKAKNQYLHSLRAMRRGLRDLRAGLRILSH